MFPRCAALAAVLCGCAGITTATTEDFGHDPWPDVTTRPDDARDASRDARADALVDAAADAPRADLGNDLAPTDAVSDAPAPSIAIGFWCGVPQRFLTAARFEEIAAAGFTFTTAPCESVDGAYNRQALSLAGASGLRVIVSDPRLADAVAGTSVNDRLDALVRDYGAAPALMGYHLVDEPGTAAFGALATVVSGLRSRDPRRVAFINLLPDYATAGQLGAPTYDDYVRRFVAEVSPAVVSYDHYNFLLGGADGASFFTNLAVVRARSLERGVPFWQIIQAISYVGHRATSEGEKRWAAMHTLAYGGTGVMYFTYWTPPQTVESFGDGILTRDGARTPQYAEVQSINRDLTAMGRYLAAATSTGVFHNGPLAAGATTRAPGSPVYIPSPAAVTVGTFASGATAYALLVNRDYRAPVETDVVLASADGAPELLDTSTGSFTPLPIVAREGALVRVRVTINRGGGVLVRMRGPLPRGAEGPEAYFGTVRADAGWHDVVDARFGTQRVSAAGWDQCPTGYRVAGRDFQSNGFWLCAREDLMARTFYVGNVVADAGNYFRVQGGAATRAGSQGWDTCTAGRLLGHRFESNGFWVCME